MREIFIRWVSFYSMSSSASKPFRWDGGAGVAPLRRGSRPRVRGRGRGRFHPTVRIPACSASVRLRSVPVPAVGVLVLVLEIRPLLVVSNHPVADGAPAARGTAPALSLGRAVAVAAVRVASLVRLVGAHQRYPRRRRRRRGVVVLGVGPRSRVISRLLLIPPLLIPLLRPRLLPLPLRLLPRAHVRLVVVRVRREVVLPRRRGELQPLEQAGAELLHARFRALGQDDPVHAHAEDLADVHRVGADDALRDDG